MLHLTLWPWNEASEAPSSTAQPGDSDRAGGGGHDLENMRQTTVLKQLFDLYS